MTGVVVNPVSNSLSEILLKERISTWTRDLCLFSICNALTGILLRYILCLYQVSSVSLCWNLSLSSPSVSCPVVSNIADYWFIKLFQQFSALFFLFMLHWFGAYGRWRSAMSPLSSNTPGMQQSDSSKGLPVTSACCFYLVQCWHEVSDVFRQRCNTMCKPAVPVLLREIQAS